MIKKLIVITLDAVMTTGIKGSESSTAEASEDIYNRDVLKLIGYTGYQPKDFFSATDLPKRGELVIIQRSDSRPSSANFPYKIGAIKSIDAFMIQVITKIDPKAKDPLVTTYSSKTINIQNDKIGKMRESRNIYSKPPEKKTIVISFLPEDDERASFPPPQG